MIIDLNINLYIQPKKFSFLEELKTKFLGITLKNTFCV